MDCCFSKFPKNECSWCKKYKPDSKKIVFHCKYQNRYICKDCYNLLYLNISKVPFENRSDLFG